MKKRDFLKSILASGVAIVTIPALANEDLLELYGNGIHDDTDAIQDLLDGHHVKCRNAIIKRTGGKIDLSGGKFLISRTINVNHDSSANAISRAQFILSKDFKSGKCDTPSSIRITKTSPDSEYYNNVSIN